MLRITLILLALFAIQTSSATTVYKYIDENGNLVFTDEPRKGAEELDVQPVPTVPAIPIPAPPPAKEKPKDFKYNKIVIVSPEDQKNFINAVDPVVVQVALSPNLRDGDKIQLLLNGEPKGTPISSTQFTLDNLDRGAYAASVQILDKEGNEVGSSPSISFFIKRNSVLMPKPVKPSPAAK